MQHMQHMQREHAGTSGHEIGKRMANTESPESAGAQTSVSEILATLMTESAGPDEPLSRVERKRRKTRDRIIATAARLMRSRPLDELTIAEITDAADVGHGTFYLHFKSKYEVVVPIIFQATLEWDKAVQKATREIADPAEAVAYSGRHMARLIIADPLWRWFLRESGVPTDDVRGILGRFVTRDIEKGLQSKRFQLGDMDVAMHYVFGGVVSALTLVLETEQPDKKIDHVIELMLRTLGLPPEEARDIARQPLDALELDV